MSLLASEMSQYLPSEAVDFCVSAYRLCQTWDDLIDTGSAEATEINAAFQDALLEWQRNPFYLANHSALTTLLGSAIIQWHTANAIEMAKDEPLYGHSFMLRAAVFHLFTYCVYLAHGMEAAKAISPRIYALYEETFGGYVEEMKDA